MSKASDELTTREREVLELITRGYTNPQIANELALSENTVESHVRSILHKLGAPNRTVAAVYAVTRGLTPMGKNNGNP